MEYIEPLITADAILSIFDPETRVSIHNSDVYRDVKNKIDGVVLQALKRLKEDGYLDTQIASEYYSLTGRTTSFIVGGKYKGLCDREKAKEIKLLEREKVEKEQIQSVIDTNRAVQTNFTYQKKFGDRSLLLATISTLFIGATIYLSVIDKTSQRLQDIEKVMRSQDTTLRNNRLSLKETNSSIQKPKTDTVFLKQK